jgi:hypothetical protein
MATPFISCFYGLMDSLKGIGSIPIRNVRSEAHGSTLDVGDMQVQPGFQLAGRIVLADGKPVPPETRVLASREEAWDSQTATVGPDGRFSFTDLPPEHLSLSTNVRGYRPSTQNASFDLLNRLGLLGTVEGDINHAGETDKLTGTGIGNDRHRQMWGTARHGTAVLQGESAFVTMQRADDSLHRDITGRALDIGADGQHMALFHDSSVSRRDVPDLDQPPAL